MTTLNISNDQRVGCIGRTGSGKTVLMEKLLESQPRVLVIDDKHRCNFPGYHLTDSESAALLEPKTIFRPNGKILDAFWDDVLTTLHEAGGGVLYIDELAEQSTPGRMDPGLKKILRLGRELGVGLWWSAQSATEIFNTAIRQADILCLFLNVGASDRDKVIKTAGDIGEVTAKLELHEFVIFESANQAYDPDAIAAFKLQLPNTTSVPVG
jgi:hypothetical protein